MHLINHSLKKSAAIAAAGALMFSLFVSGGMVMAAPPSTPVVTSPGAVSSTTTSPVAIYGTAEAGVEVRVSGGATPASGMADGDGNWMALVNLTPNAANYLEFTALNSGGEVSGTASITINHTSGTPPDTTAPNVPVIVFPVSPHATSSDPITVYGTAENNSVITITGGVTPVTVTTSAGGNWSASVNLTDNSTNALSVRATDASGNMSGAATLNVTHSTMGGDMTPPAAPIVTFPTSPSATTTSPITIYGTAEVGSQILVSGGGTPASATTDSSGNFTALVNLTPNSVNVLNLIARDAAGNDSTATVLAITHGSGTTTPDVTAPAAPVITFPNTDPYTTSSVAVVVTGTAEAGSIVRITGGNANGSTTATAGGNFSFLLPLAMSSTTTYFFTATDAAGNVSSSTDLTITQSALATTTTATSSPFIRLVGDASVSLFICNASTTLGFVDPGFSAVDSAGNTITATSTGTVNVTTAGTYTITYIATSGTSTATTTRTVVVLPCGSGGGGGGGGSSSSSGGGGGSAGDSNQNNNNSSGGTTSGNDFTFIPFFTTSGTPVGTTQVLGESFVPGLPTTGAGDEMFQSLMAILLASGLVVIGLSLSKGRKDNADLTV